MAAAIPQILVTLGVGILSSVLLRKKNRTPVQSDSPTALARRGTPIPYLIGKRRLGSIFGYAGNRRVAKESVEGGKGFGGGPEVDIYYEQGMHWLAYPGPAAFLHEIQKNGKAIFQGPISPSTHPSGSTIDLGAEGAFVIYWGENNQPVNTLLGTATGISSRWPRMAGVYWNEKRLGQSPNWGVLTYVFEVGLNYSLLTQSDGYRQARSSPGSLSLPIVTANAFGIRIEGNHVSDLRPNTTVDILDNTATGNTQLTVQQATLVTESTGSGTSFSQTTFTDIDFLESTAGYSDDGTLVPHTTEGESGYNPAHIMAQLLFGPHPYGKGLDTQDFNIDGGRGSLESLGVLLQSEGVFGSVIARENGADLEEILGGLLQDIGVFISLNPVTGRYDFMPIRDIGDVVPNFTDEFFVEDPEIFTDHEKGESPRLLFVFEDETRNFADNTIGGYETDGEFEFTQGFNEKPVQLVIPTSYAVAARAAERRSQEELGKGSSYKLQMHRGARQLMPGMQFTTDKTSERLVCVSKKVSTNSPRVEVQAIADFVSTEEVLAQETPGGAAPVELLRAESPPAVALLEVSRYVSQGQFLAVTPVIRAHNQILRHNIWLSSDDTSFRSVLLTSSVQTGGTLTAELASDTDTELDSGTVQFSDLGPDITSLVLDLSADDTNFRSGRQILLIGEEIMFVDGVAASGGDWFFGRIIRARYGTAPATHAAGTPVFLLDSTGTSPFNEPEMSIGNTLYAKVQAVAGDSVPLADIPSISKTMEGTGIVPMAPTGISVRKSTSDPVTNDYRTGEDMVFNWSYHGFQTLGTGAGMQPAGNATAVSPVQGQFRLDFKTLGGTVRGTYFTSDTTFTYTNASLVSDFGVEPNFKACITHLESGYESSPAEIEIRRA